MYHHSLRQDVFIKDEYHYLSVSKVGAFTVYDSLDCTFECLGNPSCLSFNLAASKGADGKLRCELLSSEKYSSPEEYKRNESFHHFSIKTPCMSSPCQNGGTCVANYKYHSFDCRCKEGFYGEFCEEGLKNGIQLCCRENFILYRLNVSRLVTLLLDSKLVSVLCHFGNFGCGDGGWTPVMKMDGNKQTFHYETAFWRNKETFHPDGGKTGFDSQETKLPSYWNTSFSKICLGMKINNQTNFIVINKQANSLYSLIADGQYRSTSLGRDKWMSLIGSNASLQLNCKKEGFNAKCTLSGRSKARIGILGNDQTDCHECNSRLGFGSEGNYDDRRNTCGNLDNHKGKRLSIKTMGYILVQ
ncbi:unnamed protein product [Porites lobata]|uniref:EGF-like domain-containing protein n=1 Tax=Porites lobata TaxID=104759 RepID=A0ABN8NKE8_9CNID|nr:unnamed protein product [Porites lobata]